MDIKNKSIQSENWCRKDNDQDICAVNPFNSCNACDCDDFYFQESVVNEIKKGCFESYIKEVQDLALSNIPAIAGDSAKNVNIVATFRNHAIVADNNSNMYRLSLESKEGKLSLIKSEKIEDFKKLSPGDVEKEMENDLKLNLMQSIALKTEQCENSLRESFDRFFNFKVLKMASGFINIRK